MMTTEPGAQPSPAAAHYRRPDWFTRNVFNRLLSGLTRLGVSVWGSRVLEHRGRGHRIAHESAQLGAGQVGWRNCSGPRECARRVTAWRPDSPRPMPFR